MRVTSVLPLFRFVVTLQLILTSFVVVLSQTPSPTPDSRGIGVQGQGPQTGSQATQQAREAKPQLVLQTGYNQIFGATKLVFSPDGRLLASGAYRSNSIKLWETATGRELRVLSTGTQSSTTVSPAIAFSRDGKLVAAAAGNNVVKVWDVVSGREVQSLSGPQGSFASVLGTSFIGFGNNNQLITISDTIRAWDVTSGKELWSQQSGGIEVARVMGNDTGVAITPGGDQLALVRTDPDSQIIFFDLSSGREVKTIKLPDKELESFQLSFAADGHLQLAAILDKRLKLWDFNPKQNERDLGPTQKEYSYLKFSRDGRLLAHSENYSIKVWEAATGKELTTLKVPTNTHFKADIDAFLAFSEDGKRMATGGFNSPTIIWEAETAKQVTKLSGRINIAGNVSFSADGNRLSSGGKTSWDLRTGRGLRLSTFVTDHLLALPSPDGKVVAFSSPNRSVIEIVETPGSRKLYSLDPGLSSFVAEHLHFSADSTMLIVSYGPDYNKPQQTPAVMPSTTIKIWDLKSGRELRTLQHTDVTVDASLNNDGRTIAVIGQKGQIELWDQATGNKLRDLKSAPAQIGAGTFGINPGSIRPGQMPNMPDMSAISQMMTNMLGSMSAGTPGQTVTSLAFSPDGRILATGGVESKSNFDQMMNQAMTQGGRQKKGQKTPTPDEMMNNLKVETTGQVQLWDVTSGQLLATVKGHGKGVSRVAFSRDGRILASASTDNTIKMWEASSGRELRTLVGHTGAIESMDFSPDARLFASAAEDGSTILWDANTGEHLLTLISLDDGAEWMVVTPQGLFDGTPVSWNQILWRYNQDTFNVAPIEWFFNEYYYPGLLADVSGGKRPKVAQDVSKKDRRQPVVKLSLGGDAPAAGGVSSRVVKVRIDVTDSPADAEHPKGPGARDLRLFRNGSLVKVWHGDVLKGQPSVSIEQELTVTAGPNRLVAYAFNADNVKSKDAPLVFEGGESLKRKGTAYILAVGVNDYANSQYNLKYAVADAQSFGDEVRQRQLQIGSIERVEVIPLLNQDATKANILSALKRMAGVGEPPSLKASTLDKIKRVEPEDTVIIYFAGHGTAQQQRFYLIPHDLGYTGDREKLTEEGLKTILTHSVSDLELEAAVEGLDANHLVLVIDACNSGQALEAEEKRRGPMNSKGLAQLAYEKGMYILTAAQSFQAALEAAQLGHGLLTYALVEEGLKTAVADNEPKDGVVNAREWLDFATLRVPQMQEAKMKESRGVGIEIAFVEGEKSAEPDKRSVQRPRVFYRRELESNPLIVAKPQ